MLFSLLQYAFGFGECCHVGTAWARAWAPGCADFGRRYEYWLRAAVAPCVHWIYLDCAPFHLVQASLKTDGVVRQDLITPVRHKLPELRKVIQP